MSRSAMPTKFETKKELPLKRVLLAYGSADPSDPIHGLEKELREQGVDVLLAKESLSSDPARWMNLARLSQAIVFIRYENGDGGHLQSQLYRAKLFGLPIVRWWVGTDVLNSLASEDAKNAARLVDQAVDLNLAVSPHLVTELQDIGIKAEYVPSLCNDFKPLQETPVMNLPKGVLVYLPTKRRAFYGEEVVIAAIEANPDLSFFIVADDTHSLQKYPNVNSLGWVENLNEIWPEIGILLRITEHDGMPRMVLDALSRARYVIYSQPFDGCWLAKSSEEALEYLNYFKNLKELNRAGPTITHNFTATAGTLYTDSLVQLLQPPLSLFRLKTIVTSLIKLPAILPRRLKPFSSATRVK